MKQQRLIDADALKKSIEELKRSPWFNSVLNLSWHAGIKEAVEVVERLCIDKAPTIEAEPVRHGKWRFVNCVTGLRCQCSECLHWVDAGTDRNYCPNCGADMRGEE